MNRVGTCSANKVFLRILVDLKRTFFARVEEGGLVSDFGFRVEDLIKARDLNWVRVVHSVPLISYRRTEDHRDLRSGSMPP